MADEGLARYRATEEVLERDQAYITSRYELSTNTTNNKDLRKIAQQFNTADKLMTQSAIPEGQRAIQGTRDIFVDMLFGRGHGRI